MLLNIKTVFLSKNVRLVHMQNIAYTVPKKLCNAWSI